MRLYPEPPMFGDERRQWYNWRLNPNVHINNFLLEFTTDYDMPNIILTDDAYMINGGVLHPNDEEVIKAAGDNPRIMSAVEFIRAIQNGEIDPKGDDPELLDRLEKLTENIPKGLTPEQLQTLGRAAAVTESHFAAHVMQYLTPEKANHVRTLRCEKRYSWRAIAQACFDEWEGSWEPSSNQLMGRELCIQSAKMLNEDAGTAPWN
jgi:hypothetical protein